MLNYGNFLMNCKYLFKALNIWANVMIAIDSLIQNKVKHII